MLYDIPPPLPSNETHQEWSDASFKPGYLNQDILTIPLEIGLIGSLNYFYTPHSKTLFPVVDEATNQSNDATTYTRSFMLPYAVGAGALVFGGLTLCNDDFRIWTQARGFAHALLLSEVATSGAKVIFQKKRPNYDSQIQANHGEDTDDSRASFYSDHANQAFAFTTYTSLLMFKFSNSIVISTLYTTAAVAASSVISYSRVQNHAHNLSDVIVAAVMGTTISGLTFFRVQEVDAEINSHVHEKKSLVPSSTSWQITPNMLYDEVGRVWYTADLQVSI
ncbi:MAG: phosphatase PAP2 family protein [Bdellovibrionota bacterium]